MRFGKHVALGGLLSAGLTLGWASGTTRAEDKPDPYGQPPAGKPEGRDRERGERGERGERPDPQRMVERMRGRLEGLNLSSEQKSKIDEILAKGKTDLEAAVKQLEGGGGPPSPERGQPVRDVMRDLHEKVMNALDETQREKMRESMRNAGPGGPGGPGRPGGPDGPGGLRPGEGRRGPGPGGPDRAPNAGPGGPGTGPGPTAMVTHLKENLGKLDLNDEQKKKVDALLSETQKKLSEMQTEAEKTQAEVRGKFREAIQSSHDRLNEILTEEQRTKLREMMPRPQPRGEGDGAKHGEGKPRPDGPPPGK